MTRHHCMTCADGGPCKCAVYYTAAGVFCNVIMQIIQRKIPKRCIHKKRRAS